MTERSRWTTEGGSCYDEVEVGLVGKAGRSRVPYAISLLSLALLEACGGASSRDPRSSPGPSGAGGESEGPGVVNGGEAAGGAMNGSAEVGGATNGGTGGSTASGGTPFSGGAGGMEGGPEPEALPLPRGCEARARMETAESCSLAVFCDSVSRTATCQKLTSDEWRCQCEPLHRGRVYHVQSAPGLQACAVAASACSEKALELGEESCDGPGASSPQGDCSAELTCRRPVEIDVETDARAWLMRFGSASCQHTDQGSSFECSCFYDDVVSEYRLVAEGDEPACGPLIDFCMSGTPPAREGPEQCVLEGAISNGTGCERHEMCFIPTALNDEVVAGEPAVRFADCAPRLDGGSECYCSTASAIFQFEIAEAPLDAACQFAARACSPDVTVTTSGAPSCEPTSLDASDTTHCYADLSCMQDATIDGREVVAEGRLLVECARVDEATPWSCSCASARETATFELGATGVSPTEACTQAPARCLDHIAVHFGPYSEFVSPPSPLP